MYIDMPPEGVQISRDLFAGRGARRITRITICLQHLAVLIMYAFRLERFINNIYFISYYLKKKQTFCSKHNILFLSKILLNFTFRLPK